MANRVKIGKTTIHVGDIIAVHQKIKEEDKERIQVFKGVVIVIKGKGTGKSLTVRRIAAGGVGVERIWSVICPSILKIKVIRRGKVRRAKLYYLRKKLGKEATRIKTKKEKAVEASKVKKNEKKKPGQSRRKSGSKVSPEK
jgi:large subunit ribosomal protein L19